MSDAIAPAIRKPPTAAQVATVASGNALEFYDFLTSAFFSAEIGRTFFPSGDPTRSLLALLATFGASFFMRPVGTLVIGRIADRIGRKPAVLLFFRLTCFAVAALALVPSRARIGIATPILVILCRMIGGFALGANTAPRRPSCPRSRLWWRGSSPRAPMRCPISSSFSHRSGAVFIAGAGSRATSGLV